MHYAHLQISDKTVTIDTTPYVKGAVLLTKAHDRKFLTSKIEQMVDDHNRLTTKSLNEVYDKLNEVGLMPSPKELWLSMVAHRSAIIDACICDCDVCYQTLQEILQ